MNNDKKLALEKTTVKHFGARVRTGIQTGIVLTAPTQSMPTTLPPSAGINHGTRRF